MEGIKINHPKKQFFLRFFHDNNPCIENFCADEERVVTGFSIEKIEKLVTMCLTEKKYAVCHIMQLMAVVQNTEDGGDGGDKDETSVFYSRVKKKKIQEN